MVSLLNVNNLLHKRHIHAVVMGNGWRWRNNEMQSYQILTVLFFFPTNDLYKFSDKQLTLIGSFRTPAFFFYKKLVFYAIIDQIFDFVKTKLLTLVRLS